MIPIVIPLHPGGGRFGTNEELRFSLRSLERHFSEPFQLFIVGHHLPAWMKGAELIRCEHGLKSALRQAAELLPEGFFWCYDDNVLLQDRTAEQMKVTPALRGWRGAETGWSRQLQQIRERMETEGIEPVDYSRPHGPYWFDGSMVEEGFRDWPGMKGKFPWESWILSKRKWPAVHGVTRQLYGAFSPPAENHVYLNYNDGGNTVELREWLRAKFPNASRFEREVSAVSTSGVEVHSVRYGDAWWIKTCGDTIDDWCRRHGHGLRLWGSASIHPGYPTPKFCVLDMLEEFLRGKNEWLVHIDGDVFIDAAAPALPDIPGMRGLVLREDLPKPGEDFQKWRGKHFPGDTAADKWTYRNTGVWLCDREAAARMLRASQRPYHKGYLEQHHMNWWASKAAADGMAVTTLPGEWNRLMGWETKEKSYFYHLAGKDKAGKFRAVRELVGLVKPLGCVIEESAPQTFEELVEACRITDGETLEIPETEIDSKARWNASLIVVPSLDGQCNGAIWQLLKGLETGQWSRLIIASTPGANNGQRKPRRHGPQPYDVERAKALTGDPARQEVAGKTYLIYER